MGLGLILGFLLHTTPHPSPTVSAEFWRALKADWSPLCVSHERNMGAGLGEKNMTAVFVSAIGGSEKVSIREVCASGLISFISGLEVI